MVYTNNTIVPIISPIPETKPGIFILCIIRLRIIPFRYCRSFVALLLRSDNNSIFGKSVPYRESASTKYCLLTDVKDENNTVSYSALATVTLRTGPMKDVPAEIKTIDLVRTYENI
jgi:hypothetical protein